MVLVYLVRHGKYNPWDVKGVPEHVKSDEGRLNYAALDEKGIEQMKTAGESIKGKLADMGVKDVKIYHGPAVRVVQSAQIIASSIAPVNSTLEPRDELKLYGSDFPSVLGDIHNTAIVVGHDSYFEEYTGQQFEHGQFRSITK